MPRIVKDNDVLTGKERTSAFAIFYQSLVIVLLAMLLLSLVRTSLPSKSYGSSNALGDAIMVILGGPLAGFLWLLGAIFFAGQKGALRNFFFWLGYINIAAAAIVYILAIMGII